MCVCFKCVSALSYFHINEDTITWGGGRDKKKKLKVGFSV